MPFTGFCVLWGGLEMGWDLDGGKMCRHRRKRAIHNCWFSRFNVSILFDRCADSTFPAGEDTGGTPCGGFSFLAVLLIVTVLDDVL
jgi:hypothetical protein